MCQKKLCSCINEKILEKTFKTIRYPHNLHYIMRPNKLASGG
jgi:hypothetical protein